MDGWVSRWRVNRWVSEWMEGGWMGVTQTQDTNKGNKDHMHSATLLHPADFVRGGTYEVSIVGWVGGWVDGGWVIPGTPTGSHVQRHPAPPGRSRARGHL